jgi:hypothetical protein
LLLDLFAAPLVHTLQPAHELRVGALHEAHAITPNV